MHTGSYALNAQPQNLASENSRAPRFFSQALCGTKALFWELLEPKVTQGLGWGGLCSFDLFVQVTHFLLWPKLNIKLLKA